MYPFNTISNCEIQKEKIIYDEFKLMASAVLVSG